MSGSHVLTQNHDVLILALNKNEIEMESNFEWNRSVMHQTCSDLACYGRFYACNVLILTGNRVIFCLVFAIFLFVLATK